MSTTQNLILAQLRLREAEAAAAAEQKAETERRLVAVRAEGRQLKEECDTIADKIRRADAEELGCRKELGDLRFRIDWHHQHKPGADGFDFPSPENLAAWQSELERLTAERDQVLANLRAIQGRCPSRDHVLQLSHKVEQLAYAQRNLEGILRGERIDRWEGSVGPVS